MKYFIVQLKMKLTNGYVSILGLTEWRDYLGELE